MIYVYSSFKVKGVSNQKEDYDSQW